MNIQQSIKSIFALGAIIIGLTFVAFGQTEPPPSAPRIWVASFGLQTLDAGRTARLSVVHTAPLNSGTTGSPTAEPVRYKVRADFDVYSVRPADGSIRFLRRVSREATLLAGDGLTLDFTPSASDGGGSVRVASAVYIKRVGESETQDNAAAVSISLEVRNREGTLFLFPGTIRGFNPQPDPPLELNGNSF